jgi:hypothetical protein
MLEQEDIDQQFKLLEAHRRTLAHSLEQYQALGVLTPPALAHNIRETWTNIAQIKATLRTQGVDVTDDPIDEPHELHITVPTLTSTERRNRQRMLHRVRDFWSKGVLENSLHGAALIELGMEYKPDAVQHSWDMVIQQPGHPTRSVPSGTKIIEVYDELSGELLILGEPGSGKTTMLLELARDLLMRAEQDGNYPIPVVFNLSSWAGKRKPLIEWLVDELNLRYDVPRKIGKAWVDDDLMLPLLDGLDEVRKEYRGECVEAINVFRRTHGLVNLAVCSRVADYDALAIQLKLQGAVLMQQLTPEQINAYLVSFGNQLEVLRAALSTEDVLYTLAETPLMLSIMALTYQGTTDRLMISGKVDDVRVRLFDQYMEQMFARRGIDVQYRQEQTLQWLTWLAQGMVRQRQSVFFIERLQYSWLTTRRMCRQFTVLDRIVWPVFMGLLIGLCSALASKISKPLAWNVGGAMLDPMGFGSHIALSVGTGTPLLDGLCFGITALLLSALFGGVNESDINSNKNIWRFFVIAIKGGLVTGIVAGFLIILALALTGELRNRWIIEPDFVAEINNLGYVLPSIWFGFLLGALGGVLAGGPSVQPRHVNPVEVFGWSWLRMIRSIFVGIGIGFIIGIFNALIYLLILAIANKKLIILDVNLQYIMTIGLYFALIGGLIGSIVGGLVGKELEAKTSPNQGIRRSLWNAIRTGLCVEAVVISFLGIASGLGEGPGNKLINGLLAGVVEGLNFGLASALIYGGYACISHFALRFILWRSGDIPWNYGHFLDYCTERIFLRKVGGGYIFIHRMLMEYFASLDTQSLDMSEQEGNALLSR